MHRNRIKKAPNRFRKNIHVRHNFNRDFGFDAAGRRSHLAAQSKLGLWSEQRIGLGYRHLAGPAADGTLAVLTQLSAGTAQYRTVAAHPAV